MSLQSAKYEAKVQCDDAYHANMQSHNAKGAQSEEIVRIVDSPSCSTV